VAGSTASPSRRPASCRNRCGCTRDAGAAARLGLEAQNDAAELRLRADRRLGELLAGLPNNHGARGVGVRSRDATAPTLEEVGISKSQSSRWRPWRPSPSPSSSGTSSTRGRDVKI
jgi:hypothetical protein